MSKTTFYHVTQRTAAAEQAMYGISPMEAYRLPTSDDSASVELFTSASAAFQAIQEAYRSGAGELVVLEVSLTPGTELLFTTDNRVYMGHEVGHRLPEAACSFELEGRVEAPSITNIHYAPPPALPARPESTLSTRVPSFA
ncbi:hypothetical protein ACTVH1_18385 [Gluconobacter cerinus]